ncbi:hypothetical protein BZA70DRAFT_94313 [Myxozyma melibiosi]|uniref:Uncharacterized protein n=1 Tax=Myxozyma melibiosi TaxID=54550 RepID=A0ABR1EYZ8_9ASCO
MDDSSVDDDLSSSTHVANNQRPALPRFVPRATQSDQSADLPARPPARPLKRRKADDSRTDDLTFMISSDDIVEDHEDVYMRSETLRYSPASSLQEDFDPVDTRASVSNTIVQNPTDLRRPIFRPAKSIPDADIYQPDTLSSSQETFHEQDLPRRSSLDEDQLESSLSNPTVDKDNIEEYDSDRLDDSSDMTFTPPKIGITPRKPGPSPLRVFSPDQSPSRTDQSAKPTSPPEDTPPRKRSRALLSANALSTLIQGRQRISSLSDSPLPSSHCLSLTPSTPRRPLAATAGQTSTPMLSHSIANLVRANIMKLQSDVKLNAITDRNLSTAAAETKSIRNLSTAAAETKSTRKQPTSIGYELWRVVRENLGYAHGIKSYAGFTFVRLTPHHHQQPAVWALLFNVGDNISSDLGGYDYATTSSTTTESLTGLMLRNKSLYRDSVVKLYKPIWYIELSDTDVVALHHARFDAVSAQSDPDDSYINDTSSNRVLVCIKWKMET